MGFLTLMLVLMATRQLLVVWNTPQPWVLVTDLYSSELPGLLVSVMALLSVFFLHRLLCDRMAVEIRLNEAQRISQTGSWEHEPETDGFSWSDESYRIINLEPGDKKASYSMYIGLIHPDDRESVLERYAAALKQGVPLDITYRLLFKDGQIKIVRERSHSMLRKSGKTVKAIGVVQDITQSYQVEEELRRSEEKYRKLVESSPYCIHQIDNDGRLVSMNRAGLKMLGLEKESDIVGVPYINAVSDENQKRISSLMEDAFKGEYSTFEFSGKEGKHFLSNFVPITDEDGVIDRLLGITQDITEQKEAELELARNEEIFRSVFEQAAVGVALVDVKSKEYVRVNSYYYDLLGYSKQEFLDLTFQQLTHSDDLEEDLKGIKALDNGDVKAYKMDKRYYHKNGSIVWVTLAVSVVWGTDNEPDYYLAIVQDITERKQSELELKKLSRSIEASTSGVTITNPDGVIEYVNPKFTDITGYSKEEIVGKNVSIMNSEETPDDVYIELRKIIHAGGVWKGELQDRKKDGSLYWNRISIIGVRDDKGVITHVVANQEDVTHEYELTEQLSYQATHDALTGLVNRREFERRVERSVSTVRLGHSEHAMCYMDLDQFKVVNDTCGHAAGDEMLRQLSNTLQRVVRKRDTLARLGGDEFGVLIEDCSSEHALRVASNLQKVIQDYQFVWQDQIFKVSVSIGLVPIDGTFPSVTELLKHADAACYMAKDLGRNRIHVYDGEDVSLARRHGEMQWVTRIHKALEENRFSLFAQTIVPLDSRQNKHYELLLRMKDEDDQLIPPGAFLPAAERYNLIDRLDKWVIKRAFTVLAEHPVFLEQIHFVSINLSGQSLTTPDFLSFIIEELKNTGIEPDKICFEITETTAITNLSTASRFIARLKELGCQFALDDFGSGLSSFAYLKNLSVDYLKIDGMFVKDIIDDPIDRAMVKSINEIGHVMGMQTIAEFVENDEIKGLLREIGVDYGQGYGISKPSSFDDLLARSGKVVELKRIESNSGFK